MKNEYALITGASQGLGKYLCFALAKRNYNILLVSLPNENLESVTKQVKQFGVQADYFETDITKKQQIIDLANWANKYPISILVNNAGCGGSKKIDEVSVDYIETMIQLNITASTLITKLVLPNLNHQPKAYILNISSMAAFSPIGYKTVYPATKKFLEWFSRGLHYELKAQNTSVTVVYPGPMRTNEEVSNRINQQSKFVNAGVVDLETVAELSLNGMFKNKRKVIPGKLNKLSRFILAILPTKTTIAMLSKAIKKELDT
ncbi:MAG: SDR family NAD(P)-dependent oxidoreductase [Flavobacteriaceae bacterium]|nr:SDR family NAD(P)-dependent oxidoreductase [Flavobacteriaceae bacterium]